MATITFKGNPIETVGDVPGVGAQAPAFTLVGTDLQEKSLSDFAGKKKILDQDGDGILSTDEIAAAIREHLGGKHLKKDSKGKRRTEEEVEKMIERMLYQLDKDHDGKVAMEDLMAFVDTVKREEKEAKMLQKLAKRSWRKFGIIIKRKTK